MRMSTRLARLKARLDQRAKNFAVGLREFAYLVMWITLAPFVELVRVRSSVGL